MNLQGGFQSPRSCSYQAASPVETNPTVRQIYNRLYEKPFNKRRISDLLDERDGLICGVCNGFQALIKLGLVPYGEIREAQALNPTLTYNRIARHQSRLVRTRVASNKSPWLMRYNVGDVHLTPVSHGEGRFVCSAELLENWRETGRLLRSTPISPARLPWIWIQTPTVRTGLSRG